MRKKFGLNGSSRFYIVVMSDNLELSTETHIHTHTHTHTYLHVHRCAAKS